MRNISVWKDACLEMIIKCEPSQERGGKISAVFLQKQPVSHVHYPGLKFVRWKIYFSATRSFKFHMCSSTNLRFGSALNIMHQYQALCWSISI